MKGHKAMGHIFDDIRIELEQAKSKYNALVSTHEGYAVIFEEVDELWELVKKNKGIKGSDEMVKECIQIAAMAIRFIDDLCLELEHGLS